LVSTLKIVDINLGSYRLSITPVLRETQIELTNFLKKERPS